ncbi:unnamed protein product [Bursaphelenchus okinawaensis]|uniref:Uncharacterized protein n=1 Tax=Bursaphelenchus okinawaensis TaxID=465554 RepID=A0A811JQM0_9BILA|nr:unnamed protein product [Bursaphelenchus okinawaensis]CAG9078509.1 unnamed protein product [Bursaphelenchus okinawaensis]
MPLTVDIAEFNCGPQNNESFRRLAFSFHQSLLNLASTLVVLEFNMFDGVRHYSSQNLGISFERLHENRQLYNSPQNRSTIRDPRYMVVELKMFIGVVLNALRRGSERHVLWLKFVVNCLPYLDRTLPTFCVHVVDQLCRNIYACVSSNFAGLTTNSLSNSTDGSYEALVSEPTTPIKTFEDFRFPKTDVFSALGAIQSQNYPSGYCIGLLKTLTSILHYGIIDASPASTPFLLLRASFSNFSAASYSHSTAYGRDSTVSTNSSSSNNMSSMVGSAISAIPGINFLGKVFTSSDSGNTHTSALSAKLESKSYEPYKIAKKELTKTFPAVLAILSDVWYFTSHGVQPRTPIGNSSTICGHILGLVGPMAKSQPQVLLHSAALVWQTRGIPLSMKKAQDHPSFDYTHHQKSLSELMLKVFSFAEMVNSTLDLLKDTAGKTPSTSNTTTTITSKNQEKTVATNPNEVPLLELLHCTMNIIATSELRQTWAALNVLFNETNPINMSPRGVFLIFTILSDFVKLCGSQVVIEDRSISRGCQEACQRIIEALNLIVGWQLESTTWLKRTLVVKQDTSNQKLSDVSPTLEFKNTGSMSENNSIKGSTNSLAPRQSNQPSIDSNSQLAGSVAQLSTMTFESKKSSSSLIRSSLKDGNNNKKDPTNSTQALFLLAENLAELIDSICRSEDKDKLIPTVQAVWNNTLPYLKAKSARNVRFFLASSMFLASLSSFNYMRSVWKKAAMDLLLDSNFFKMDNKALKQWLIVIDNLMTNDKTSFKELLQRIPSGNTTAISNFMTNKDQENEMRAQALKRLAFVILSSQTDQYCSNLPEIQERLTDNLRQSSVPVVHSQVFVCYRVLLLRVRPGNLSSIWPSMVTEVVQVLSQLETHIFQSTLDELRSPKDENLLQLFLSSCKFLEALCTLPSGYIPQFQLFNWAFVSPITPDPQHEGFVPFATRLDQLMEKKFGALSDRDKEMRSASLCSVKTLTAVQELQPFFHALAFQHKTRISNLGGSFQETEMRDANYLNGSLTFNSALQRLETALHVDFADHWQL